MFCEKNERSKNLCQNIFEKTAICRKSCVVSRTQVLYDREKKKVKYAVQENLGIL